MRVVETGLVISLETKLRISICLQIMPSHVSLSLSIFSLRENLLSENIAIDIVLFVCTVQVCHTA